MLEKLRKIENRNKKKKTRFPSTFVSFLHSGPAKLHVHKKKYGKKNVWLVIWNIFSYIVNVIIPTDELRFFRGVGEAPTSCSFGQQ